MYSSSALSQYHDKSIKSDQLHYIVDFGRLCFGTCPSPFGVMKSPNERDRGNRFPCKGRTAITSLSFMKTWTCTKLFQCSLKRSGSTVSRGTHLVNSITFQCCFYCSWPGWACQSLFEHSPTSITIISRLGSSPKIRIKPTKASLRTAQLVSNITSRLGSS